MDRRLWVELGGAVVLFAGALVGCGFHLRGEVRLSADLGRVHVQATDPFSPLKHDLEAALQRAGARVEPAPGDGIAEISLNAVSLAPIVRSVGANAFVNEFSMVYHVELEIADASGKTLLPKQVIERSRVYTFDQTQAIGTSVEQEEIKKEMEREMVEAVLRKIEAAGRHS
jgi:LPS-assembly lipoprotein